jgi:hypothetical protein
MRFHRGNGAGLGASHQTGWTGLIGRLLDMSGRLDSGTVLATAKSDLIGQLSRKQVTGV